MFGAKEQNEQIQKQLDELKDIDDYKQKLKMLQQEIDNLHYDDDQLGKYKEQS